jgi:hypothetical protein
VALLVNPEFPATPGIEARVQAAAPSLGLKVTFLSANDGATLEKALDSLEKSPPDALVPTEVARTFGLSLVPSFLTRADRVIQ